MDSTRELSFPSTPNTGSWCLHPNLTPSMKQTIQFTREKETKNTVKFEEQPAAGKPPVIGSLYVQKWAAGTADKLTVTLEISK